MAAREGRVFQQATDILKQAGARRPELIVLDLDYTIWPYWVEMFGPKDADRKAKLFPEAGEIIEACHAFPVRLAVASRSPSPKSAAAFLQKLGLAEGVFEEILVIPYEDKGEVHIPTLHKRLGVPYRSILFFDDESPNIHSVSRLGVTSILVSTRKGFCLEAFKKGVEQHAQKA